MQFQVLDLLGLNILSLSGLLDFYVESWVYVCQNLQLRFVFLFLFVCFNTSPKEGRSKGNKKERKERGENLSSTLMDVEQVLLAHFSDLEDSCVIYLGSLVVLSVEAECFASPCSGKCWIAAPR